MVIILSDIHVRGNDILIKEWDYNYVMRGEGTNILKKLFKEYLGEDLKLIKMKQIIYDTYVIENMTINDLRAYFDKFKEKLTEIKKYKNDKRITETKNGVYWLFERDFDIGKMLLPVDIDMLSF